ncbi:MAG: NAD(P)-binding protein [Candidatus Jidaibacter sp.]|jgi:hypothetical protein|nr:NAD(P)-binding protein [Candidatus Jidaibacter sp.]
MKKRIAIIGAGISGLTLAYNLKDFADVVIFEKARGVGGRMSTRYADPFYFDHGAQCFTARTEPFRLFLKPFIEDGTIVEWRGEVINFEIAKKATKRLWLEPHLVASPKMNSLCKKMAYGLKINFSTEVTPLLTKGSDGWHLFSKEGIFLGVFDCVISTAPPAQTAILFGKHISNTSTLHNSKMQGCYSLMVGLNKTWDKEWIAAKVRNNPIKWISINSTKPGRDENVTAIVAHSRNAWAELHIDTDIEQVQKLLLTEFESVSGIDCSKADYISTHRWRYAIVDQTQKSGPFLDAAQGLASTGDWCVTSRIEEVWINAVDLANQIKT